MITVSLFTLHTDTVHRHEQCIYSERDKRRGIGPHSDHILYRRRANYAGLAAEEMVVNVIDHGFTKDKKNHSVDVRVVCKNDEVILRIKDDCVPFDPKERNHLTEGGDAVSNVGIRTVYSIANDINYQNLFGLNVLTIRI